MFTPHVERVTKSASEAARAIGRLLLYVSGPSQRKRFLLSTVVTAKLMYASSVWSETAFKTMKNRQLAGRAQRLISLRIIRAYRTVSDDATLVLAKTLPADLLASERVRVRSRRRSEPLKSVEKIRNEERAQTLDLWQARWQSSVKGTWTRRLFPDLRRWYPAKQTTIQRIPS